MLLQGNLVEAAAHQPGWPPGRKNGPLSGLEVVAGDIAFIQHQRETGGAGLRNELADHLLEASARATTSVTFPS